VGGCGVRAAVEYPRTFGETASSNTRTIEKSGITWIAVWVKSNRDWEGLRLMETKISRKGRLEVSFIWSTVRGGGLINHSPEWNSSS
jgi:hypothetical protein